MNFMDMYGFKCDYYELVDCLIYWDGSAKDLFESLREMLINEIYWRCFEEFAEDVRLLLND